MFTSASSATYKKALGTDRRPYIGIGGPMHRENDLVEEALSLCSDSKPYAKKRTVLEEAPRREVHTKYLHREEAPFGGVEEAPSIEEALTAEAPRTKKRPFVQEALVTDRRPHV